MIFPMKKNYIDRFQREALSATSLTHPNIVNIYDVGEDGDIHYIVMEYVKGETLKEYIQNNSPISPNRNHNNHETINIGNSDCS